MYHGDAKMQVALLSDIHSHLVALDAVLADAARAGVDRILCLGDIVDVGPQPRETIARLRERNIECIRGNHDPLDEEPLLPFLADVEAWTLSLLSAEERAWLRDLPEEMEFEIDGTRLWCVHGSPRSCTEEILATTPNETLRQWSLGRDFDVLACGHTHVPFVRRLDQQWVVNVGSAGQPFREVQRGATAPEILPWFEYAILRTSSRGPHIELRRVPADRALVEEATRASGMPHQEQWLALFRW